MMRGLICGPKLATCGLILSIWGVIMLVSLFYEFSSGICSPASARRTLGLEQLSNVAFSGRSDVACVLT